MNKSYLTIGTIATFMTGMCHSDTQAPRAPPVAIAPTTCTRQGTPERGMPMTHQTVTTSGTATMGTALAH